MALAGTLMQVLLRNPLADPYILGTSGGAAVAALLAMTAGIVLGLARGAQAEDAPDRAARAAKVAEARKALPVFEPVKVREKPKK